MAKRAQAGVSEDENWKIYVRHENTLDNYTWPQNWEFLVTEYSRLNNILSSRDHSDPPPRPTARTLTTEKLAEMKDLRLPPLMGHGSKEKWLPKTLPVTIQNDYGFRASSKTKWVKNINTIFPRKPLVSFTKQLNWPTDCID